MSTSYLSNHNFESLHRNQLQPTRFGIIRVVLTAPAKLRRTSPSIFQPENVEPLLDTHEAAALLGITHDALNKRRQRKHGPAYFRTRSGRIHYRRSAVEEYRAAQFVRRETTR